MCVCDRFEHTTISSRSIEKLMRADGVKHFSVELRMVIDGRPVVLVRGVTDSGQIMHTILCPGDVHYNKSKKKSEDGAMRVDRLILDTYKCPRKEAMRAEIRTRFVEDYRKYASEGDASEIIMDLFARVSRGEYVGEFVPGCLYAQEVAELLGEFFNALDGISSAKSYEPEIARRSRYAISRPPFFLDLGISFDKMIGYLDRHGAITYAQLSAEECRKAAFFEDTLALLDDLVESRRIGLYGMILCLPFKPEIEDAARRLLIEGDPLLLFELSREALTMQVQRHHDPSFATLAIFKNDRSEPLHAKQCALRYDAMFGPDVEDVASWVEYFTHFVE